ncbi:MAG: KOW motif-containing protein [Pseudobdellovibrionaceae bacterium]
MATKLKIRKGATVQVIAGQDKGKKGTVISVDAVKMKIKVQGIKVMTHFDKKDGLKEKEAYFDYSNVKLLDAPVAAAKGKKTAAKTAKKKTASKSA